MSQVTIHKDSFGRNCVRGELKVKFEVLLPSSEITELTEKQALDLIKADRKRLVQKLDCGELILNSPIEIV